MTDAKHYWNEYFEKHQNLGDPDEFLVQMLPRLQKGKVLDLAMGNGVNSLLLAKNGFKVEGFDVSNVAVKQAQFHAVEQGVSLVADCLDLDMYLMQLMTYDSIVMINFKPQLKRFYGELVRGLKQGGTLLISSLGVEAMNDAIARTESFKDYYFESNEVLRHLHGLKILFYQESEVNGRHVVQCLAQKPFDKDALKYNIFDMHTEGSGEPKKSKHLELAEALFKK